jgi:hypothetical protein
VAVAACAVVVSLRGGHTSIAQWQCAVKRTRVDSAGQPSHVFPHAPLLRARCACSVRRGVPAVRSTGTSNGGHDYPGFFFPCAGICPRLFMYGWPSPALSVPRHSASVCTDTLPYACTYKEHPSAVFSIRGYGYNATSCTTPQHATA